MIAFVATGQWFSALLLSLCVFGQAQVVIGQGSPSPPSLPTFTASQLIPQLKNADPGTRIGAALFLGRLKDPTAVEPLIAALDDYDERVRAVVIRALGQIGVEHLVVALKGPNKRVRIKRSRGVGKDQ